MYATPTELRSALGVNSTVLPDEKAEALLETGSDQIDRMLGARAINADTGRKVTESQVLAWQWSRIKRATIQIASTLYAKPDILTEQQFDRIKGPDFETQGPIRKGSAIFGDDVIDLVSGSCLGVYSGRAR